MGQEIENSQFEAADFAEFKQRLDLETKLLGQWIADGALAVNEPMAGCELEAWLIDGCGRPAPVNQSFLQALNNPLVVPELSTFNVELNTHPQILGPGLFQTLHNDLAGLWRQCETTAAEMNAHLLMIGTLPTVQQADLCLENMSSMQRYRALNEQVFRLRDGQPLRLDIEGAEHLKTTHDDVMLEAAATSFQIHFKVDVRDAARAFNLSKIISAPMVAISANAPYLFGYDLWDETRIPLFEQAVSVGASDYSKRVTFGIRYAEESILECFEANRDRYPVLLPRLLDEPVETLPHLRLHNGTIWRWNRPLVGFSDAGTPHIRIEHRVVPAGPTAADSIANMAFYFGAVAEMLAAPEAAENKLPFQKARQNFYHCARHGLQAEVRWLDGSSHKLQELCLNELIPMAARGLSRLGFAESEAGYWLDIIKQRVASGRTGSHWQRAWVAKHGADFNELVLAYRQRQSTDQPVHSWNL